jgi:uncharacterized membrane protein YhhN
MTIRECIESKARQIRVLWLLSLVAIAVGITLLPQMVDRLDVYGPLAIAIPTMIVTTRIMWRTRCPRCRNTLYDLVGRASAQGLERMPMSCSHCSLSIDEPMRPL